MNHYWKNIKRNKLLSVLFIYSVICGYALTADNISMYSIRKCLNINDDTDT